MTSSQSKQSFNQPGESTREKIARVDFKNEMIGAIAIIFSLRNISRKAGVPVYKN